MDAQHIAIQPPRMAVLALVLFLAVCSLLGLVKMRNEWKRSQFIGQEFDRTHSLTVAGRGRVEAKPDIARFQMSVSLEGYNLAALQKQNTAKTNAIIAFLQQQGVPEADIQTSAYQINPSWDYTEKGRKFRGFQIHNILGVKVRDFVTIGPILEQVIGLGATDVNFRFDFDARDQLVAQAREKAIDDAKAKARDLARQLGVHLVRITSFGDYATSGGVRDEEIMMSDKAPGAESPQSPPAVMAGASTLETAVTLVYEIH